MFGSILAAATRRLCLKIKGGPARPSIGPLISVSGGGVTSRLVPVVSSDVGSNKKQSSLQDRSHSRIHSRRQGAQDVEITGQRNTLQEIVEKYGADILRLWVASTDYRGDVSITQTIITNLADVYRRIRNTSRFLLCESQRVLTLLRTRFRTRTFRRWIAIY